MKTITILSLGPDSGELLTLGALTAMRTAKVLVLRTRRHAAAELLEREGVAFETLDALYEQSEDFDELCALAAKALIARASETEALCYAVSEPANDATVRALSQALPEGIALRVQGGVTLAENAACAVLPYGVNTENLRTVTALSVDALRVQADCPQVVTEIDNRCLASDVKLWLGDLFDDGMTVYFLENAAEPFAAARPIALCELAALIVRRSKRSAVFLILMGSAFLLVVLPAQSVMERQIGIELDSDRAMNPAHYVNMGLNAEHDGAFNMPDLDAVLAVPAKERTAWCLRTAWARVKEYGVPGMAEHLLRKALVNFADGGFAWGIDFARNDLPVKDERFTPWVRSVVYSDGTRYPALHALEQAVWLLLLVLCPFGAFGLRRLCAEQETPVPAAMLLSVIGIIAFNMLFEAKARYVFVMVPVMIAVSAAGLCALRGRKRGR